jgi:hypothetical protein
MFPNTISKIIFSVISESVIVLINQSRDRNNEVPISLLFYFQLCSSSAARLSPVKSKQRYLLFALSTIVNGLQDIQLLDNMQCKLREKCPNKSDDLYNCWDDECTGWSHVKCSCLLLTRYNVAVEDRPDLEEKNGLGEPIVFCKKGCFLKWQAAKKRQAKDAIKASKAPPKKRKTPWEDDGTLDVLLEWLTTEGNYAEYCGSNGNKGKSKSQYHKELALLIKEKLPESDRSEKDVENKITSLERQFRVASDWASNTGAGVDNPGDFQAAVIQRCALFNELEPIMGERPNAKPLYSNENDSDDEDSMPPLGVSVTAVSQSMNNGGEGNGNLTPSATAHRPSPNASSISTKSTSSKKRISTSQTVGSKKGKSGVDDFLSSFLGVQEEEDSTLKNLRVREVEAKEREAEARMIEAEANREVLNIQAKANLLRERKKLLEEGISASDIDALLPLPKL